MLAAITRRTPTASRITSTALRSFALKADATSPSPSSSPAATPPATSPPVTPPSDAASDKGVATTPSTPSAETEDPSKHSSDIAFKPTESGWGYSRNYSGGFENIFGKRGSMAGTHAVEVVTAADGNYSSEFDSVFGGNCTGGENAAGKGERGKISDFEKGYAAGYKAGLLGGR